MVGGFRAEDVTDLVKIEGKEMDKSISRNTSSRCSRLRICNKKEEMGTHLVLHLFPPSFLFSIL